MNFEFGSNKLCESRPRQEGSEIRMPMAIVILCGPHDLDPAQHGGRADDVPPVRAFRDACIESG